MAGALFAGENILAAAIRTSNLAFIAVDMQIDFRMPERAAVAGNLKRVYFNDFKWFVLGLHNLVS